MREHIQRSPAMLAILVMLAVLLLVAPASADQPPKIDISVSGDIPDWAFALGTNNSTAIILNLKCTGQCNPWNVSVKDTLDGGKRSTWAGRMQEYNITAGSWVEPGHVLGANMTVEGESTGSVIGSVATLGPTDQPIETGNDKVDEPGIQVAIIIRQQVSYTDLRLTNGNVYRVVVSFTGVAKLRPGSELR